MRQPITLNIKEYLTEVQKEVFEVIEKNKYILISSNPASGKTTLFANLCIDSLPSKKKNRIVFCAPYIIIQEQFKQKLVTSKVNVDLELNASSKRKKINKEDRIITSTFNSFPRISGDLDSDDIVIIDEAHSLLNVFNDKMTNKHTHFGNFYKSLCNTKAKVVLMTGTPIDSFYHWFDDLQELKVIKDSAKAKVNIQYSNHKDNDIVIQFAEECIKKHGKDSLNVIYIKSRSQCDKHAEIIRSLGYRGLILTSDTKFTDEYKELVKSSLISKGYQFLLTTNVISTGTNILNDNMGKALMLHEHDPIEIKQFSKRFRKKLDIEIDVVNRIDKKVNEYEDLRIRLIKKRDVHREYLAIIKKHLQSEIEAHKNDILNFDEFGGEASQLNPKKRYETYLQRNLLQEIYFHQEITKTYNNRIELSKALNQFDDIISVEIQEYSSDKVESMFDEKTYLENKKEHISNTIDGFIAQPEVYLLAFSNYIEVYHKYSGLNLINDILGKFEIDIVTVEKSNSIAVNPILINEIIEPLVESYPLFLIEEAKSSLRNCLTFIKNVAKNKRSKHLTSLWFNNKFHEFLEIPDKYNPENEGLIIKKPLETKNKDIIYFLLNQAYLYLMRHEEIYFKHFIDSFITSSNNKNLRTDEYFPWTNQLYIKDGHIMDINRNFGFGLLYSIFAIKTNQVERTHPIVRDRGRVNTFLPEDLDSIKSFSFLNEKSMTEVIKSLKPIKTFPPTYYYRSINLNETERVIVDKNYLTLLASYACQ